MKKVLFCFSTLGVVSAFAASYNVTLFDQSTIAGKDLKPGDYKLELKDGAIVLKHNKDVTETPVKEENGDKKYSNTMVRYNSKHEIIEICLRGTTKKLVLTGVQSNANGGI